ncbi:PucR family transcriptional regulator [Neobacillus mesonae]|uniref:PucR family transcriptional regulator n=1 Tax=Neobacillus mesonae TaxID=1193713 RepID=UPI002574868D|nr:helix-turn-helix domain-containing protein [Neobacillus mesonae]MED4206038.1 helix-turn-helix domain-containing protein [Neobacillus mesonae]
MLKKLLNYYPNSITFSNLPENPSDQYYIFYHEAENEWIGILKSTINDQEIKLLKSLFTFIDTENVNNSTLAQKWYDFLLMDGPKPTEKIQSELRFIQFYIHTDELSQVEIEAALTGFFSEEVNIIWENRNKGIVIEDTKHISLSEDELLSMSETLETDLYAKISFYIGKPYTLSGRLPSLFRKESEFFAFGMAQLTETTIFTYERIFPAYIAYHLPEELIQKINTEILELFQSDTELFSTIKIFLENNLNASLTAKKLYIHRNTLQYRIDKFTEKTGINLKDFYGAFTVFLACLIFEYQTK